MTQTSITNDSTAPERPVFPPGRYGRRRDSRRRRWVRPVAVIAALAISTLISLKLYTQYGQPKFTPTVIALSKVTDTSITVTFTVRKPSGEAAVCTVYALAHSGAHVGAADVAVPPGKNVRMTYTLTTTQRSYVANVPSCHALSG